MNGFSDDLICPKISLSTSALACTIASEWSKYKIYCNAIAPGFIDSRELPKQKEHLRAGKGYADNSKKHIPLGIGGVPNNIAGMVLALCSSLGDYVNGQTITVHESDIKEITFFGFLSD